MSGARIRRALPTGTICKPCNGLITIYNSPAKLTNPLIILIYNLVDTFVHSNQVQTATRQGTIFSYTPLFIAVSKFRGAAERRHNFESAKDLILTRKAVDIKAYKMNKKIIVFGLPFSLSTIVLPFKRCTIGL